MLDCLFEISGSLMERAGDWERCDMGMGKMSGMLEVSRLLIWVVK